MKSTEPTLQCPMPWPLILPLQLILTQFCVAQNMFNLVLIILN